MQMSGQLYTYFYSLPLGQECSEFTNRKRARLHSFSGHVANRNNCPCQESKLNDPAIVYHLKLLE
jgi:hypothetical protein